MAASEGELDTLLEEARSELIEMLLSTDSGSVTIHVSRTNQLRKESNRSGEGRQLSADELQRIKQTHARPRSAGRPLPVR